MIDDVIGVIGGAVGAYQAADTVMNHAPPAGPSSKIQPSEAVAQLERRVNRLALATQAMWELLRERSTVTDKELADKILEVDLRDGQTDGRMAPTFLECPNCHKPTNSRRPTCVYCGVEVKRRHLFDL
jgi:hypothetical protein